MKSPYIVIHLGGSAVVPHLSDEGGINTAFLRDFLVFIRRQLRKGKRFIIVIGGGKVCRVYQRSARKVEKISNWDLDWIGIHAARLNSHLLRTIFVKEAYSVIIDHDPLEEEVEMMKHSDRNLFIASAWRPGWSTDYVAVRGAGNVIIAKDTPFVYDVDPRKNKAAKALKKISWKAYKKIIPSAWTPGLSTPVDPVAARLAEKIKVTAKVLKAANLKSFKAAVDGKPFEGTVIIP
ncbi:MAG: UMP kinase [Parcubacteria group bacterium]|nr:UMP kinase [Parcubacteria group bacterium]